MATQKSTTSFRRWGWAALPLGAFAVFCFFAAAPFLGVFLMMPTLVIVLLAWRGRQTPWWALVGWMLALWGAIALLLADPAQGPAPIAWLFAIGGIALGVAGLIINALKRKAPLPDESPA